MTPLRLERLERRDTPAGTVTGTLRGSTWTLVGDELNNAVTVNVNGGPGNFGLTGANTSLEGDTVVEGVRNIVFKMADGNDTVTFNNSGVPAELAGNLSFQGGDGNNTLSLADMDIGGNLAVGNGDAETLDAMSFNHNTAISRTNVRGQVTVRFGDGNSWTQIGGGPEKRSIGKGLRATHGLGADILELQSMDVGGGISFKPGEPLTNGDLVSGGSLSISTTTTERARIGGSVSVSIPSGEAGIDLSEVDIAGSLKFTAAGEQESLVVLNRVSVEGKTSIRTGEGVTGVEIDSGVFRALAVSLGGGNDLVTIERSGSPSPSAFLGRTKFDLGAGNDELRIGQAGNAAEQLQVFAAATFDGGTGTDTRDVANLFAPFGDPTFLGFTDV